MPDPAMISLAGNISLFLRVDTLLLALRFIKDVGNCKAVGVIGTFSSEGVEATVVSPDKCGTFSETRKFLIERVTYKLSLRAIGILSPKTTSKSRTG